MQHINWRRAPNHITEETNQAHYCSRLAQGLWRLNNDAMNSLTPNRRAAYVEQPKKLSPTFYRTARACAINPAPSPSLPELLGLSGQTEETISIGSITPRISCYAGIVLTERSRPHRPGKTPHTPSSAAPRTDTPPPCSNGSKQTDEKLAGQSCFKTKSRTVVETKY
ncbi:hypothetical protein HPB52_021067 [Rhipicephalus sanguineus]|uniref:Uncharacterized protein n=1 Tax=Rhipicephalus sanguineus TaxID=34632 RepID=A0A9D4Q5D9_RHISA|nr:hypothetical protein HPB52_021067 [Rhipicephalus sanguineus]